MLVGESVDLVKELASELFLGKPSQILAAVGAKKVVGTPAAANGLRAVDDKAVEFLPFEFAPSVFQRVVSLQREANVDAVSFAIGQCLQYVRSRHE